MKRNKKFAFFVFLLSLTLFVSSCSDSSPRNILTDYLNDPDYPQDYWVTSTPSAQGMDEKILEDFNSYINDNRYTIHSVLIIKNGYLVYERYGFLNNPGTLHILNSSTKSFVSALIGIALDEGKVGALSDKMLSYFSGMSIKNMSTAKSNITVEDLLTMRSGLEWDDQQIFYEYLNASNAVQYILDKKMVSDPDTKWFYNSGSSHLLSAIITEATGKSAEEYAKVKLFSPLGITKFNWEADKQNINQGGVGLSIAPRDMAKFGYLFLSKGKWKDKQIISEDWVTTSTAVHSDTYWAGDYGYHWWVPNSDCFASQGACGQNIYVYPDKNIVIVYTAGLPVETADSTLIKLNTDFIIPAIK